MKIVALIGELIRIHSEHGDLDVWMQEITAEGGDEVRCAIARRSPEFSPDGLPVTGVIAWLTSDRGFS
jgi:hypothetical protein